MTLRVCIPRPPEEPFLERLSARLPSGVVILTEDAPCDILVAGVPTREQLERGPGAVVIPYAGVPSKTRELLRDFPAVALHNLHHNAAPTAELAVALLLAAAKALVPLDRALRRGDWRPRYERRNELLLAGRAALVLGGGAVGTRVAEACRGLGMEVRCVRRRDGGGWRSLLREVHALILALPLTRETEGIVGGEELSRLPPGAVLVNVGRGPLVDEEALYGALREGRIAAGLDVWYRYPDQPSDRADTAPASFPFHDLDNVVLSPHRAGSCDGIEELRAEHLARLLGAAAGGEPMPNRVDVERGY